MSADDSAILALFRQWIAAHAAAAKLSGETVEDDDAFAAALDALDENFEAPIAAMVAEGAIGVAIKAYLIVHGEFGACHGQHPASVGFSPVIYGDDPEDTPTYRNAASLIRDVVRLIPEIAPLAVRMTERPATGGKGPGHDAGATRTEQVGFGRVEEIGFGRWPHDEPGECIVTQPDGSRWRYRPE